MAAGNCEDGVEAAGETEGATGKAHMEVLYLLPEFCITFNHEIRYMQLQQYTV